MVEKNLLPEQVYFLGSLNQNCLQRGKILVAGHQTFNLP